MGKNKIVIRQNYVGTTWESDYEGTRKRSHSIKTWTLQYLPARTFNHIHLERPTFDAAK